MELLIGTKFEQIVVVKMFLVLVGVLMLNSAPISGKFITVKR